jgi:hypothetical protein
MFRILVVSLAGLSLALSSIAVGSPVLRTRVPGTRAAAAINPKDFVKQVSNSYFPLMPGTTLRYRGEKDGLPAVDVFEVTHQTRTIQRVRTTVINDSLYLAGRLREVTVDWYAQDRHGNVWYFGEATKTLTPKGALESTEGSWRSGVKRARAGIFFPGGPALGKQGQQEFFKGHAEDHFQVLSLKASVKVPYLSTEAALKTEEFTPLEPKVLDNKYYVSGIGTVLELAVKGPAERLELFSVQRP